MILVIYVHKEGYVGTKAKMLAKRQPAPLFPRYRSQAAAA